MQFLPLTLADADLMEIDTLPGSDDPFERTPRQEALAIAVSAWIAANPEASEIPDFSSEFLPAQFAYCRDGEVLGVVVHLGQEFVEPNGTADFAILATQTIYPIVPAGDALVAALAEFLIEADTGEIYEIRRR